jgi:hypothetical protein
MQALKQFDDRLASVDAEFRQPLAAVRGQPRPFRTEARETLRTGWPADAGRLNAWMDRLFAGEWLANLRAGVQSQLGYVESAMLWGNLWRFGNVEDMLCARALQLQSRGEHGAALDLIRVALDTTRFRRMRAGAIPFRIAADVEPKIFMVLTRWAAEVRDDEELLREALALVRDSDARRPPPSDMVKAEYVAVRDMLLALHGSPWAKDSFEQSRQLIWLAPWERARTMRVLNRLFADLLQRAAEPASMQASLITTKRVAELSSSSGVVDLGAVLRETELALKQTERDLMWRATQLQLALLLYERRHGQPAPDLNALVPELIPDLPRDPYGGGPFRYRVSAGEPITATSGRQDVVDQGRGIIWSVGPDLKDDGGMDHTRDQIFLVPRPVKR